MSASSYVDVLPMISVQLLPVLIDHACTMISCPLTSVHSMHDSNLWYNVCMLTSYTSLSIKDMRPLLWKLSCYWSLYTQCMLWINEDGESVIHIVQQSSPDAYYICRRSIIHAIACWCLLNVIVIIKMLIMTLLIHGTRFIVAVNNGSIYGSIAYR